ncbi:L-fucose:H+ symporter permease [Peribacillus butanolivorans]|uniref:L-fucose:H+ symporter permease n=1 Tax=Peribacillus TaxID=2675229 RepID=UPI002868FD60|nr:L-fucose:H+ symporter permease [Peribacillus sp. R9-11]WMX58717.1 L-fucose:H+ symporter permease [Peribacillus sp. R9-11]
MKTQNIIQLPDGYLNRTPIFQFILLSLLFPLWAVAASLNDILITQFKHVFELSDFASALVQSAFYGGYFLIAIPASMVIKKTNYKFAIITGLLFYIVGCSLFYPASHMATYTMFLFAIFSIAIGLGFLETAANTYSSMIGPSKYAILRLNISQTFYPIGAISGILLGKYLVFQKGASLEAQMATMSPAEAQAFGLNMLEHTLEPYKYIIFVLVGVLVLFVLTKFPSCKPEVKSSNASEKSPGIIQTLKYLGGNKRFRKGIAAQFLYVGMQVTVWSFTIRLALDLNPDINERTASNFMVYSFIAFFVGKFIANFLMTRFSPSKVLVSYSVIGSALLAYVSFVPNMTAVYAAVAVSMLFGPCWPTIYAETLEVVKDKKYTETAGAILVMAIVGGAFVPAVQGFASDLFGSMQTAFLVSMACFIYVGFYFFGEMKKQKTSEKPAEKPIASA